MKLTTAFFSIFLMFQCNIISQSFNIEWQGCYGGSDTEYPKDIIQVPNGYLVTGHTKSSNGDISFNHGLTDVWVFRINNIGEIIWEKTYGGSKGDNSETILSDGQGNFYIIGATDSDNGDISIDPYPNTWDFWIIKIDIDGNILWEKVFGGNGLDVVWTGITTNDNGLIAIGWTTSNDGDISNYYGLFDTWLIKVNSQGEKEWDFTIGTEGQDVGQAIIQTSDGGYLVGCASVIWDIGNITCEPFNSYSEAVLVKLDADRNIEWQQCYGGSDNDGILDVIELEDGYLFSAYGGSDDGDLTGSGWHGLDDIWIVKTDFFGSVIWQKCFGGSRYETAKNIFLESDGGFIIAGNTQSVDGDVSNNHSVSDTEADIWLLKLSSEGELLWEHSFGGIWDEQLDFGILKKGDSNFLIAGQTDYGPSFDVACTPHGGLYDKDFWVFEVKDTLVGVQQNIAVENVVKVYPNPAKDYVVFETSPPLIPPHGGTSGTDGATVVIVDIFGREVARLPVKPPNGSKPRSGFKTVWDTRNIKPGVYMYSFTVSGIANTNKIVIQK